MTTTQAHGFGCQILERRLRAEEVQDVEDLRGIGQAVARARSSAPMKLGTALYAMNSNATGVSGRASTHTCANQSAI